MTDKVNTELPSPATGILSKILIPEGSPVEVFKAMGLIEPSGSKPAETPSAPKPAEAAPAPAAGRDSAAEALFLRAELQRAARDAAGERARIGDVADGLRGPDDRRHVKTALSEIGRFVAIVARSAIVGQHRERHL